MVNKLLLVSLVSFHIFVALANLAAFFIIPFVERWYVAIPIMSLILTMSLAKWWRCVLTEWENQLREQLKMRKIGGFLGFYLIYPILRLFGIKRPNKMSKSEIYTLNL